MLSYKTALAIFFFNCIVIIKPVVAALVPRGDSLSDKQEVVRQINADPISFDPIRVIGLAEAHVIRDLFAGLTIKMQQVVYSSCSQSLDNCR